MKAYPLYLNGELTITEDTYPIKNPATDEAFARMSSVDRPGVAKAIQDAHTAFLSWRQIPGKNRGEMLNQVASELHRRREEVARIITLENGKPLPQSQSEVAFAIDHLRWFAEEARRIYGRVVPHQIEEKRHLVIRSPIGVVGAISPWNFPLMLAVRKVAPALAAGCTVVLKPASRTPLSSAVFAECAHAAGLPKGVFQLVVGPSDPLGKEFLDNPLCRKITFTGSTEVGRKLIEGAAKRIKPLSLELGGLAPLIVFDDADLGDAVSETVRAKFRNTGQSCIAANRIYVQRAIYEPFLKLFVEKVRDFRVGEGLDPKTEIGPLIDQEALDKGLEHIQDAVLGGAKVLCGGSRIERKGFFLQPTVLADVPKGALCMQEETFAPVAPVCPFDSEGEVIERANNSPFGLSAYAFTRDISRMFRLAESFEAGVISINDGVPTATQAPFGGVKQSGWGRELGTEGLDSFLETKHISIGI
jgi:succinate-semialdehyde dehydrogenase/glutarate-semialdehyde dehydrogenase